MAKSKYELKLLRDISETKYALHSYKTYEPEEEQTIQDLEWMLKSLQFSLDNYRKNGKK